MTRVKGGMMAAVTSQSTVNLNLPKRGEKPRDAVLAGAFSVERDHVAYVQKGGVLHGVLIVGEQAAWHQNVTTRIRSVEKSKQRIRH